MGRRSAVSSDPRAIQEVIESGRKADASLSGRVAALESATPGRRYLFVSTHKYVVTQTLADTLVASANLPGGLLGTSNLMEIRGFWEVYNVSATTYNFTVFLRAGTRALQLGPVAVPTTTPALATVSIFLCGDGTTTKQKAFGLISIGRPYNDFTGSNLREGANATSFDVDEMLDQQLQLTVTLDNTDALFKITTLATIFGYPVPAQG